MQRWDAVQIRINPEIKSYIKSRAEACGVSMSALVQYALFTLPDTEEKRREVKGWYERFDAMLRQSELSDRPTVDAIRIEGEPGFNDRLKEWGLN